ncbi:MOSC domain-containing protein [Aeromonas piscicola]|uniref:MOSC domain-containing protein n=1 Tax=Aeromonas piscicola TaxID=600645 RepID=A0ABT7QHQ4_9GAMM|nr:MOSC domain-containing protein [Aeromonas piscicola]MDM5133494.1 MOSC domain-containing protein [Aeromonas piscicola]
MRISLFIGQSAEMNAELAPALVSAIDKHVAGNPLWCSFSGLEGDEQSDLRHHGGPDRALHYYPADHYPWWHNWQTALGLAAPRTPWQPAAFGENLSGLGLTEVEACIGDVYRLGEALIQISQPRSPCFKLNQRFGYGQMSQVMQLNGRCGWLLRVLEEGRVAPQETMALVDRPYPALTVKRTADILFNQLRDETDLLLLLENPALSPNWRQHAAHWLEHGVVADWRRRLLGPAEFQLP